MTHDSHSLPRFPMVSPSSLTFYRVQTAWAGDHVAVEDRPQQTSRDDEHRRRRGYTLPPGAGALAGRCRLYLAALPPACTCPQRPCGMNMVPDGTTRTGAFIAVWFPGHVRTGSASIARLDSRVSCLATRYHPQIPTQTTT